MWRLFLLSVIQWSVRNVPLLSRINSTGNSPVHTEWTQMQNRFPAISGSPPRNPMQPSYRRTNFNAPPSPAHTLQPSFPPRMPQSSGTATNLSIWRDHSSDIFWRNPEFHLTHSSFFPLASLQALCMITLSSEYPIRLTLSQHLLPSACVWLGSPMTFSQTHSKLLTQEGVF